MNILIVSDYYTPGNSRLLEAHASGLSERNHHVGLLAGSDRPEKNARDLTDLNVDPFLFEYAPDANSFRTFTAWLLGVRSEYRTYCRTFGQPDCLILNQPRSALPILRSARHIPRKFYVHHAPWAEEWAVHHPRSNSRLNRALGLPYRWLQKTVRHRIERLVLSTVDRVIVLSDFMKRKVTTNHPEIIQSPAVVPGGVDPDRFRPDGRTAARRRLGWAEDTVIFTLRRLVPRMGLDRLMNAYARLTDRLGSGKNCRLVIGGTGPERENLEGKARRINGNVTFTGYIEEETLPDYYRGADLFVLPTRELEGFGLVTLEALASGTPVAGTRVGATEEILGDLDAKLLLPEYSPERWAQHLEVLLESNRPGTEFRAECRRYVLDNYTWDQALEQLDNLVIEQK